MNLKHVVSLSLFALNLGMSAIATAQVSASAQAKHRIFIQGTIKAVTDSKITVDSNQGAFVGSIARARIMLRGLPSKRDQLKVGQPVTVVGMSDKGENLVTTVFVFPKEGLKSPKIMPKKPGVTVKRAVPDASPRKAPTKPITYEEVEAKAAAKAKAKAEAEAKAKAAAAAKAKAKTKPTAKPKPGTTSSKKKPA